MTNEADPKGWWKWATTRPQSYGIYLVIPMLVFVLSFYAGTLKPQKPTSVGPPSAPVPGVPNN